MNKNILFVFLAIIGTMLVLPTVVFGYEINGKDYEFSDVVKISKKTSYILQQMVDVLDECNAVYSVIEGPCAETIVGFYEYMKNFSSVYEDNIDYILFGGEEP